MLKRKLMRIAIPFDLGSCALERAEGPRNCVLYDLEKESIGHLAHVPCLCAPSVVGSCRVRNTATGRP